MAIATLTIDVNARLANIERDMGRAAHVAEQAAQRMSGAFSAAQVAVQSLGATLAAGLSVGAFAGALKGVIDFADELNDVSQRLGINVRSLTGWTLAAQQSGTSMEAVAKGVKFFGAAILEHGEALKKAGVTATDTNTAMIQVADVFAAMPDGIEKTALAVKLFGKNGMDLIPMLNQGSQGLQEAQEKAARYGQAIALLAPQADKFNDELAEMAMHSKEWAAVLAGALLPSLNNMLEVINQISRAGGNLSEKGGALGAWLDRAFVGGDIQGRIKELEAELAVRLKPRGAGSLFSGGVLGALAGISNSGLANRIEALKRLAPLEARQEQFGPSRAMFDADRAQQAALQRARALYASLGDGGKESRDKLPDILNEAAGVSKDFAEKLQVLQGGLRTGRIGLDEYVTTVEKLIAKQPFAVQMAKDEARAREDLARVLDRVNRAEEHALKASTAFEAANAERLVGIAAQIEALGKTPEQVALIGAFADIDKQFERARQTITDTLGAIGDTDGIDRAVANLQRLAEVAKGEVSLAMVELKARQDELNASWEYGAGRALDSYLRQIQNVAASTEQTVSRAFKGMEDALVSFATTGKLSFADLARSIIADLVRMQVQQSITGPLSLLFKGGLTAAFPSLTGLSADAGAGLATFGVPSYDVGTDYVPRDTLAVVHRGERIVPAAQNVPGGGNVSVQVVNNGTPQTVRGVQRTADPQGTVVKIIVDDLHRNGPIRQKLATVLGG